MRRWWLLLALLVPLSGVAPAQSPPSSAPPPGAEAHEQPPWPSENRTDEAGERAQPGALKQQPPEREANNDSRNRAEDGPAHWYRDLPTLTAISAALGALATFLLVLVGAGQVYLYWQQHETTKRLERPWILVAPTSVPNSHYPGGVDFSVEDATSFYSVAYQLSNDGRSPAWIVGVTTKLLLIAHPTADAARRFKFPPPAYVAGEGVNYIWQGLAPREKTPDTKTVPGHGAERRAIEQRRETFILYGKIDYEGIFRRRILFWHPKTYTTNFYWIHSAARAPVWHSGPKEFTRCT